MARSILVAGATGGVGAELLRLSAEANWTTVGLYRANAQRAAELEEKWGARLTMIRCDLTKDTGVEEALARLPADYCPDVIVHLTAPAFEVKPIARNEWAEYSLQLDGILKPLVLLSRRFLKSMQRRGGGRVVAVASAVVLGKPPRGFAPYATAKHALLGYMRCLASEYAEKGIVANTVSPGPMDTALLSSLPALLTDQMRSAIPGGRFVDPGSVARAVFWLAAEAGPEITGCNLPVSSGMAF